MYKNALVKTLSRGHWIAAAITFLISLLLLIFLQNTGPDIRVLQLDRNSLLSVMGSILAAAVFFILTEFIIRVREVKETAERVFYKKVFEDFGIRDLYYQRGDQDALSAYNDLLMNARDRIWAIGITNHRFTQQHRTVLAERLRSCPGIDIRVSFLDPDTKLSTDANTDHKPESLPQIHNRIEKSVAFSSSFVTEIDGYIDLLTRSADVLSTSGGRLRIYKIISPCYFTCFVIDDNVFFFPMLARQESGQDPTIRVAKAGVLGQSIYSHFEKLLEPGPFVRVVYDNLRP